jgi:hypothetical protein
MLLCQNEGKWQLYQYRNGCIITHVTRPVRDRIRIVSSMLLVGLLFAVVFSVFCWLHGMQSRVYVDICLSI